MKLVFALVVCYTTLTYGYPQFSQPSGYSTSDEGDSDLENAQPSSGFNFSPITLKDSNASSIGSEDAVEDEEAAESQSPGAFPIASASDSRVIRRSAEDEFNSTLSEGEEGESAAFHPAIIGSDAKISRRSAEDEFNSTLSVGEEEESAAFHPAIIGSDAKISRRSAEDEFNTTSTEGEEFESAGLHPTILGSDTKISRRSAEDEFNTTSTESEEFESAGLHPTILGSDTKISRRSAEDEFNTTSTEGEEFESAGLHPTILGSGTKISRRSAEDDFNATVTDGEAVESAAFHPISVGSDAKITRRSAEDSFNLTATDEELKSVGLHPSSVGSAPRISRSAEDEFNATLSDDDTLKSDGLHPASVGSETKFSRRSADEDLASDSTSVDNSPTFLSSDSVAAGEPGSASEGESPSAFGVNAQPGSSSTGSQIGSQGVVGSPTNIRKFVRRSADDFESDSISDFSSTDASPSVVDSVQSGIVAGSVQPSDAFPSSGSSDAAGVPPVIVPLTNARQRRSQDEYEDDSGASFSDGFSDEGAVDEEYDDQGSSGDGQFEPVPIGAPQQPQVFGSDGSSQFGGSPDYSAGSFPAGVETVGSSGGDFTGPSSGSFSSSPSFAQPPSAFSPNPSGGFAASGPGAQSSFASRQGAALDDEAATDVPAVGAEYDDEETKFH